MKANYRPGRRVAAIAGALAVAGVSATALIAGTASAAGTGTCTSSVNVRSEPSANAPIVGVCERGQTTSVGETRNGFVKLDEFGGWAVARYVKTGTESSSATPNRGEEGDDSFFSSPRSNDSDSPRSTSPRSGTNPERSGSEGSSSPRSSQSAPRSSESAPRSSESAPRSSQSSPRSSESAPRSGGSSPGSTDH